MKFTNEMIEKAKTAKTAEELLELAKAENMEMTAEEAAKYFADLHKSGELSDDELDNVAGGCGGSYCPDGRAESEKDVVFLFVEGQYVWVIAKSLACFIQGIIIKREARHYSGGWYPHYYVKYTSEQDRSRDGWVSQEEIRKP